MCLLNFQPTQPHVTQNQLQPPLQPSLYPPSTRQHRVVRVHAGGCITSLDMAGVSLTLMAVDDARLAALDAPTTAPAWPATGGAINAAKPLVSLPPAIHSLRKRRQRLLAGRSLEGATAEGRVTERAVRAAAAALLAVTDQLNELDALAGDGDTGSTVELAAQALLAAPEGAFAGPADQALEAVATVVRSAVGGSLGGLYNLGLTAAAAALPRDRPADAAGWAAAMAAGLRAVQAYGNARAGSRTMLDALLPACDALAGAAAGGGAAAARAAAKAAAAGAEATRGMAAEAGRASYTRGAALAERDPGAVAVGVWLDAVARELEGAA
jgi:dihydroxyacetone kinase